MSTVAVVLRVILIKATPLFLDSTVYSSCDTFFMPTAHLSPRILAKEKVKCSFMPSAV